MKKLLSILVIGFALVVTGCGSRLRGDTITVCTSAQSSVINSANDITVTIVGSNENIVTWTDTITMDIATYEMYFFGVVDYFADDAHIEDWFAQWGDPTTGLSWHLLSVEGDTLTFDAVFHYEYLTDAEISEFWGIDAAQVTVTLGILDLEYLGASCTTN